MSSISAIAAETSAPSDNKLVIPYGVSALSSAAGENPPTVAIGRAQRMPLRLWHGPYPFAEPPRGCFYRLPDRTLMARLRAAAAACYGAPEADCVAVGPGSQSLIQWVPRLLAPGRVNVLAPTYGEHAPAWAAAGHRVRLVEDWDALGRDCEVAVVVNPNNPDGREIAGDRLLGLARTLAGRGGFLVVDEAFSDVRPELSLAPSCASPGVVILRSFGKFFGLAGMRLGFALAAPERAEQIASALGPWAVATPFAHVAVQALTDLRWIVETRKRLDEAARLLDQLLSEAGLEGVGGTALFRLVAHPRAPKLFEHLLAHGIYVRRFPGRTEWLRLGLPDAVGLERLEMALESWND